jgi:uncharacterized protein (DUF433 family)
MNKIKIAMAVVAAVMALSMSAVAFAQAPTPPTPPTTATPSPYAQTFWQTLASKLNTTVDKLQAAVRDALKATVAKMLTDGKLTQQQADKINSGIDSLPFNKQPFGGFMGGRGFDGGRARFDISATAFDAAAQKLGMTTQDLTTELRNGKALTDVAKEKNVSSEDLKAAIVAAVDAQLDQAVKDGNLTQAQADKAKSQLNNLSLDQLGFNRGPGNLPAAGFAMGQEALNAAAQKLGLTTQDLMSEMRSGKTLADVAKEKNVGTDDLKAAIVNAVDAQIDQAVTNGKLTQSQADNIKAQVAKIDLTQPFGMGMGRGWQFGPGMGGPRGFRPFGRGGNHAPQPATPQGSSS